jgi:hypothetical protein
MVVTGIGVDEFFVFAKLAQLAFEVVGTGGFGYCVDGCSKIETQGEREWGK